jgi:hypothetical protein
MDRELETLQGDEVDELLLSKVSELSSPRSRLVVGRKLFQELALSLLEVSRAIADFLKSGLFANANCIDFSLSRIRISSAKTN